MNFESSLKKLKLKPFWLFFIRSFNPPSITYISAIKIGCAVFKETSFFDFSKFVYNYCKKNFFVLILAVNIQFVVVATYLVVAIWIKSERGHPDHVYPTTAIITIFFSRAYFQKRIYVRSINVVWHASNVL